MKNPNQYMIIYTDPYKKYSSNNIIEFRVAYAGQEVIIVSTNEVIKDRGLID